VVVITAIERPAMGDLRPANGRTDRKPNQMTDERALDGRNDNLIVIGRPLARLS
jgi:hypothetical protein